MPASLYTIDVGPLLPDGSREVTLNQEGRPFFLVRHRAVLSAFLAFFPEPRTGPVSSASPASVASQHTRKRASAVSAHLPGGTERARPSESLASARAENAVPEEVLDALLPCAESDPGPSCVAGVEDCEYLCVFHEEELCDSRGYYESGHPQTLCSAYRAKDGTFTELALPNMLASRVIPGVTGVFVSGTLNRVDSPADLPPPVTVSGSVYYPAVDLWWMASPLALKPVYVPSSTVQQMLATSGAAATTPARRQSSGAGSPDGTPQPSASGMTGGRLYQGTPGRCAADALLLLSFGIGGFDAVCLDTEVIGHFRGPANEWYALARTDNQTVRLARTVCVPALDIVCWEWLPQSGELLGLGEVETSALTLVVPESTGTAPVQILCLTAPTQERTWVLRTPCLSSQTGTLEVLLILSVGIAPVVLPSVRPRTPPPLLFCHTPQEGLVSVMNVAALLHFDVGRGRVTADQMAALLLYSGTLEDVLGVTRDAVSPSENPRTATLPPATTAAPARQSLGKPPCLGRIESAVLVRQTHIRFTTRCDAAALASVSSSSAGACEGSAQWRRCEVSCDHTAVLPSTSGDAETLLVFVLDALEAALGGDAGIAVEYAYLHTRWQRRDEQLDALETVATILTQTVLAFMTGAASAEGRPEAGSDVSAAQSQPRATIDGEKLRAALRNPLPLTAVRVNCLSALLLDVQKVSKTASAHTAPVGAPSPTTWAPATPTPWLPAMCDLALLTLHQLCESCTLQERYWPLVEPLATMVLAVSRHLGRDAYVTHYTLAHSCTAHTAGSGVRMPFSVLPRPLQQVRPAEGGADVDDSGFYALCQARGVLLPTLNTDSVADDGDAARQCARLLHAPPLLRQVLRGLVRGGGGASSTTRNGSCTTAMSLCWPIVRGVPLAHPLSVANRLYCLLMTCFSRWPPSIDTTEKTRATPQGLSGRAACEGDAAESTTNADRSARMTGHTHHLDERDWWYTLCEWLPRLYLASVKVRSQLSLGVGFPLAQALACAKESPAHDWQESMYAVVGRMDCIREPALLNALTDHASGLIRLTEAHAAAQPSHGALLQDDGVSLRSDFQKTWTDARLDVPQVLFNTAAPIALPGQVEGSEALFATLTTLSRRAMSLPTGRGMLTMSTQNFKSRDSIPVPVLNLNGVTTDGIQITNNAEDASLDRLLWPTLHNGCAAGFRFLPLRAADLDHSGAAASGGNRLPAGEGLSETESAMTRQWVVYQTRSVSPPPARAGVLLAAGVLGHLRVLQLTDIYALLVAPQPNYTWREITATAVMLGLGCSFRGTGSDMIFRCLAMHLRSLTPTNEDLEVSLDVQTAALLSIGLLCQQMPSNIFLVEMFLQEMSRLPSDEHCTKREGYALAAGMGLGLLLLGIGDGHSVQNVEERLFRFMEGARRDPPPSANQGMSTLNELGHDRDHFLTRTLLAHSAATATSGSTCTRVYEGAHYNLAVTAPAAVMALGLIYLQTESVLVASRLAPPDRLVALQAVSPLLCLLRSSMAPLVCWQRIEPTRDWLYAHVPQRLVALGKQGHATVPLATQQVNYLLLNLGHCIAGTAMAIGLRYAGSMDADARQTILAELQGFARGFIGTTGVPMTTFQKSTGAFEKCIATCAIAVSLVVAGGGDLQVLAELRKLHSRHTSHVDAYGTNMAIASAMGMLFLGSGRLTLSNARASVAALLIAMYPSWPTSAEDNVRHLQAFRQLYALAVVPRLMETMDAVTGRPVSVPIRLVLRIGRMQVKNGLGGAGGLPAGQHVLWTPVPLGKEEQEVCLQTPCLLPPSETIESVEIRSTTHYPLVITNQQSRTIGDRGLVVRVLEKRDPRNAQQTPLGSVSRPFAAESLAEVRVLGWLHYLIHHRDPLSASSVLLIIDELSLLLSAYSILSTLPLGSRMGTQSGENGAGSAGGLRGGRYAGRPAAGSAATVSLAPEPHRLLRHDFLLSVGDTLKARYGFLFLRGPSGTCSGHPLHALLIQRRSADFVLDLVATHPLGTAAFPCVFATGSDCPQCTHADCTAADGDSGSTSSRAVNARQWLVEALCFFRITPHLLALRELLSQEAARLTAHSTRRLALLRLNLSLSLPMHTLEGVVRCCFDL